MLSEQRQTTLCMWNDLGTSHTLHFVYNSFAREVLALLVYKRRGIPFFQAWCNSIAGPATFFQDYMALSGL